MSINSKNSNFADDTGYRREQIHLHYQYLDLKTYTIKNE